MILVKRFFCTLKASLQREPSGVFVLAIAVRNLFHSACSGTASPPDARFDVF